MSNIYVQEPPTEGKVCLETSVGDIDIELWSRECPKACRNFVQLCMEGYYDKTKFFRVVPEFIVQGGDPTNTGQGGESIWGKTFKDEFHSRLRMVRRGLVCMANAGKDDNGSQFFFTLAATKELQNKHTIFGKVGGDTIYNMIRLGEGHIEDGDRPKYPHKIIKTKVLINPFPDIVPRQTITQEVDKSEKREKKSSKMKATKDFKLLSFGEEAEGDEETLTKVSKASKSKSKSAHDLAKDPTLAADVGAEVQQAGKTDSDKSSDEEEEEKDEKSSRQADLASIRNKLKRRPEEGASGTSGEAVKKAKQADYDEDEVDYEYENPFEAERKRKKEEYQKEIKALTRELKGKGRKTVAEGEGKTADGKEDEEEESEGQNDLLREYHEEQKKFKAATKENIPKKKASREEQTLAILEKFKAKLSGIIVPADSEEKPPEEEVKEPSAEISTKAPEEEDDDEEIVGDDWMKNSLKFEDTNPKMAKDANTKDDDWFDIYDPRNPLNKRRREKDELEGKLKEKMRIKSTL